MIERGLITAAVVVVIIGALSAAGEQASAVFGKIDCAFTPDQCIADADGNNNADDSTDTKSQRDSDRKNK